MERAGRRCEICHAGGELCVDHDHHTGLVRGVLCHRCNKALGLLGDTVAGVRAALHYLMGAPTR